MSSQLELAEDRLALLAKTALVAVKVSALHLPLYSCQGAGASHPNGREVTRHLLGIPER